MNRKNILQNKISELMGDKEITISITHLKQQHKKPNETKIENDQERFEEVAYSQFNAAKEIVAKQNALVVVEGLSSNRDFSEIPQHIFKKVKTAFPNGIPNLYESLNDKQKNRLISYGGAIIAFCLEEKGKLYKSLGSKFNKKSDIKLNSNLITFSFLFTKREKEAVYQTIKHAVKTGKKHIDVILIFGAAHQFGDIFNFLNDDRIQFNAIDTTKDKSDIKVDRKGFIIFDKH